MREVREVIQLYRDKGQAVRDITRRIGVALSTARDMIARLERSGLAWPVPSEISNAELGLWLGHATLQSTEIYLRADPAEKLEMLGALAPLGIKPGKFRPPDKLIAMLASG